MGVKNTTIRELIDAAYKYRQAQEIAGATRLREDEVRAHTAGEWLDTVAGRVSTADYKAAVVHQSAESASPSTFYLQGWPIVHEIFNGKEHIGSFERVKGGDLHDETYHIITLSRHGKDGSEQRVRLRLNLTVFAEWAMAQPHSAYVHVEGGDAAVVYTEVVALREERVDR